MNIHKSVILSFVLSLSLYPAAAQKFFCGIHAGIAQVKYSFPVDNDLYHQAQIDPYGTFKVGASLQYGITKSLRIGTGLEYMSVSGAKDGGDIGRRLVNPNSEGRMTFDAKNTFLIFPVGFQVQLKPDNKLRPTLSGNLNFFKPLDQNISLQIEPKEPDSSYPEVGTTIHENTNSSYFGARIGGGVVASIANARELSFTLSRHFNVSRYEYSDPMNADFEKHEIRFNMWEVALGFTFGL